MINETPEMPAEMNETSEMIAEMIEMEERRSYWQPAVLLILIFVLTFVGLLWSMEVGCFLFLSLTLYIARFRSPPKLRRLFTVIWIIIAIALLVGIFIYRWLDIPELITTIANNIFLRFLIGATWSRVFWSAVAGLLVGISVVGLPLLAVMYISSEWLLAMRETYGVTRGQALRLLSTVVFNMNYPYFIIEDGDVVLAKPAGILELFGGPGVAVVKPYNAVVFEWGGEITRIEGPGVFLTKLFESPKHIIGLRPQWESFPVEEVLTKDKVPLRIRCGVGYRIESRDETAEREEKERQEVKSRREVAEWRRLPGIINGQYPVYKRTIFKAAYKAAGNWKLTTRGATTTKLREVVAEFELQDIYRLDEKSNEFILTEIGRRTKEKVAEIAHYWGVRVGTVNIDTIEVSEAVKEPVKEKVWEMWGAEYARRSTLIEADGKRGMVVTGAEAKREAASIEADATRIKALAEAEASTIEARGVREAAVEKGRGEAAAKAEEFARIVETLQQAGLKDEQMITNIIIAVFRAVGGYYDDGYSPEILQPRWPRRGETEAKEKDQTG